MTHYVADPDGKDCYGKYDVEVPPDHIPNDALIEVEDLDSYDVIEWRYETNL